MFGKWIGKIAAILIAILLAFTFGIRLLSSLTTIVLSARTGNLAPLILLVLLTFGISIIETRIKSESRFSALLTVFAWFAIGYSSLAIGFTALIFGSSASVLSVGFFLFFCIFARDPIQQKTRFLSLLNSHASYADTVLHNSEFVGSPTEKSWRVFLVPHMFFQMLIATVEERPLLPISLIRFEEADAIIIDCTEDKDWPTRIKKIVREYGITQVIELSTELSQFLGSLPYLESRNGIRPNAFRIATKPEITSRILKNPPVRTTILPSPEGPKVLVPQSEVLGMELESLPAGTEETVLFEKDASVIVQSVSKNGETAK